MGLWGKLREIGMDVLNAVDAMNEAIDGMIDLCREELGRSPTRREIYLIYRQAMECRAFADDSFAAQVS